MFRSGLMHGEIHPLNIAGEEGGKESVVRNQNDKKKLHPFHNQELQLVINRQTDKGEETLRVCPSGPGSSSVQPRRRLPANCKKGGRMSSMVDGKKKKKKKAMVANTDGRESKTGQFGTFRKRGGVEDGWEDAQTGEHGGDKGHIQEVSITSSQLTRFVRIRG